MWAYANVACILEENDENIEALNYINKALEIEDGHYKILFNKAVILNKLNKIEESKEYYYKSIEANPNYPYSFFKFICSI